MNNDFQNGGGNKKLLPSDYQKFLEYNKTVPENRQAAANWEYGNPRDYDHYGMWDALGKPTNFNEAVKNNSNWQPDQYDNSYHGFSVNPNNGVWLKSHIPGEYEPGNTAWMENMAFQLMPGPDGPMNKSLIFDSNIQRMRYIDKNKKEKGGIASLSANSTYTTTIPSATPPMYKGMPLYNNAHDTDALMQLTTNGNQIDPVTYMAYHKLLNENNKPSINYDPKSNQAWYNPLTSALNVHSPKGIIQELSHAHQDMKVPGIVPLWLAADFIKQPFFTKKESKQLYHKKHTMEHSAHSVVEPQLRKRFNVISDSLKQVQKKGMPIFGGGGGDVGIQFNPNMLGNFANYFPNEIGIQANPNMLGNFQGYQPHQIGVNVNPNILGNGYFEQQDAKAQSKLGWGNYADMGIGVFNGLAAFINNGKNNREERKQLQMNMQQPTWQATDDYRYGLNNEPMMFQNGGSYTVKKGDTLTDIAKKMGVPLEKLIAANKIKNPNLINEGAIIINPSVKGTVTSNKFMNTVAPVKNSLLEQLASASKNNPIVMHFGKQMMDNGNKLFITDKGGKKVYYEDNGTIKTGTVGTGKNDNPEATIYYPHSQLQRIANEKGARTARATSFVTPVGATGIESDYYEGKPVLAATSPGFRNMFFHPSYSKVEAQREAALKSKSLKDNAMTMGCVNCEKPTIERLTELFGHNDSHNKTDSAYVIDSRLPLNTNQHAFEVNAKKQLIKKRSFFDNFKLQNGGFVPKIQGLPFGDSRANGLVETGEAIEFSTGQYGVVDTKGRFNQDHGDSHDGTYLPGVQRVLENTSSKRKGIEDQILKLTPDQVLDTTGYRPTRSLSHAQAFEQAVDFHSNKALKIINKNNKLMERKNLSMAEKNALDLNNVFMSMMPTQDKIFDSLFQDQESVKQQFGISDSGESISKQQFGGIPKAKNGKNNSIFGTPESRKLKWELSNLNIKKSWSPTAENIAAYESKLKEYNNLINGTSSVPKPIVRANRKPTNFMNAIVGNPANPLLPSNVRPRITTPKININPVTNLPINSVASISSMDFGSFTGPYGNDKPEMYGDQAYWDNVYEDARLNMNMPGFNNVEALSPHSQYQRFVSSQMPTQLIDAFRNGEMRLTNKHLDIAKQAGIQPSELSDQQLLEGFNDGKKEIRAIRQQTVDFDNQASANNATKGYRSLDVNGNPQYVDDTFPNDSEHPLTYFNFNGPGNLQNNKPTDFMNFITGMNTFKPLADTPSTPAGIPDSTYTKHVNPFSPANKEPKSNNIDLKWYDYMSPLNGLIDSMQRDPENLFRADVNQLQSKLIDPTNQVNAITSQIRPAIKDMSNDSVGQAAKMQLLTNAARTKADIISTADNTNSQIMNNQIQYNTGVRDKQSLMDATANQDFANRVLQSKAKQSDNYKEAIDKFGNLFSSNAQLNNMIDLLKTKNFDLDASTMGISFLNNAGDLIPNGSKQPIYQYDAQGNMKPKKNNLTAAYIKQLMSSTDHRDIATLQLLKQQLAAANQ